MFSISYPSRILNVVDIPEVKNFQAEFQYNFFEPDERTNDKGSGTGAVSRSQLINLRKTVPRFVKLTFTPCVIENCSSQGSSLQSPRGQNSLGSDKSLLTEKNLGKIQSEMSFSNFNFATINFQDTGLDGKLFKIVSGSMDLRGIMGNSPVRNAKILNNLTSDQVKGNVLINAVNSLSSYGVKFVDQDLIKSRHRNVLRSLREMVIHAQINNKVIGTLVNSIVTDRFNLYADELSRLQDDANDLQNATRSGLSSTSIKSLEYDSGFIPIKVEPGDESAFSHDVWAISIVGYIIDRQEIVGTRKISRDPIVVVGGQSTTVIDTEVSYGGVYGYKIKAVAAIRLPMITTTGEPVLAIGLVASRDSSQIVVKCIDDTPPPPPADFRPSWDYDKGKLKLLWSFPPNPQRDIKRFQIFRRASISDPFELLREYDFDDSKIKSYRGENVPAWLTTSMVDDPITFFVDEEFDKDSDYIYALCSVDAHGYSSNYSIQYRVSFDMFKNALRVEMVSRSGAPKSLPNFYLRSDAFVDAMKTSGFDRMTVYFDPEYLELTDAAGNDLKLLPVSDLRATYKIQVINTDLQKSRILTLQLKDLRS